MYKGITVSFPCPKCGKETSTNINPQKFANYHGQSILTSLMGAVKLSNTGVFVCAACGEEYEKTIRTLNWQKTTFEEEFIKGIEK